MREYFFLKKNIWFDLIWYIYIFYSLIGKMGDKKKKKKKKRIKNKIKES